MKKLSLLVLLASISCGGGNESTPPATAPSSTPAPADSSAAPAASASAAPAPTASGSTAPSGDAPVAWKDMDKKQRGKFMRDSVVPKMKELFTAHDAKRFEKMSCGTCHGPGAADGSFKMPNEKLPQLPSTPEGFEALAKKKPEMMKFMGTQVKPEMAKLLGMPEMDPKNPSAGGFGCMNCHTMKK
jgi:hypothetical protein